MPSSRLFQLNNLSELTTYRLKRLLTGKRWETETYQDVTDLSTIVSNWSGCVQQHIHTYLHCQFSLYILYDTPLGYMSAVSKRELLQMLSLGKIDPDLKVRLRYAHGNVISCVLKSDIEPSVLLSNRTGVLVSTDTHDVLQTRIGGFTRPNELYCRADLDGLDVKLSSAVKHPLVNSIYLVDEDQLLAYDYPE